MVQAERKILELEHGTVESCGSKTAACAELARMAEKDSGFSTPKGICLPFGNMEHAVEVIKPHSPASLLGQALQQMQSLIQKTFSVLLPMCNNLFIG